MATETVTGATAELSTTTNDSPVDTASIAADVIKESEGGSSKSSVEAEAAADAKAEADAKAAGQDPDDFTTVPERDPSGRINRIPHTRVKTMIAKAEKALVTNLAKSLGITKAEAELKLEDLTGEITNRSTKFTELETKLAELDRIGEIMDTDDERFIRVLAKANPKYQRYLKVFEKIEEKAAAVSDEVPQPDLDLGDGRKTYSQKGLEARIAYDVKKALEAQRGEFEKEYAPIKKKYEADAVHDSVQQKMTQQLEKASKWPGWKENESEIQRVYLSDKSLSLYDAYVKVVPEKLRAEKDKAVTDEKAIEARVRERLLKEHQEAVTSTSTSPSKAVVSKKDGEIRATRDVASEVIAELEKANR